MEKRKKNEEMIVIRDKSGLGAIQMKLGKCACFVNLGNKGLRTRK